MRPTEAFLVAHESFLYCRKCCKISTSILIVVPKFLPYYNEIFTLK